MDETDRLKFADEYAPEGWDFEKLGRPDVVQMKLNPEKVKKMQHARNLQKLRESKKLPEKLREKSTVGVGEGITVLDKPEEIGKVLHIPDSGNLSYEDLLRVQNAMKNKK